MSTWTEEGLILKEIAGDAGLVTAYTPVQVEAAFQYAATILANSALADEPVEEFISTVCASALLNIQLWRANTVHPNYCAACAKLPIGGGLCHDCFNDMKAN